jgi:GT2 family glycosyltransferase
MERVAYHGNTLQFGALSRSRSIPAAGFSRLIRHTTTIDPYLDESGPSSRRLGALTLDGVSYDALDLTAPDGLTVEFRTAAPSLLRVPCALRAAPGRPVAVDATLTCDGRVSQRRVEIGPADAGRWHVLTFRVPHGAMMLTVRASDAGGSGLVCGVPSLVWRKSLRGIVRSLSFAVGTLGVMGTLRHVQGKMAVDREGGYADWVACHAMTPEGLQAERDAAAALAVRPRFALLLETPAGTDPSRLALTRASLDAQVYDEWEAWPVADAAARNAALEQSRADFVGVIRAGDRLSPVALLRAAQHAADDIDVLYTDEDVWPAGGERTSPRFKPDWSPEYLRTCMYPGRLFLARRTAVTAAGGYRAPADGALDYDLALRLAARAGRIVHVPDVLYHRGSADPGHPDSADRAAGAALADDCGRRGRPAIVEPGAIAGVWRARVRPLTVDEAPRIAIVIPTDGRSPGRGAPALVAQCVRSLRERTQYPHYELLVCDNGNLSADTRAYLDTVPHRRVTYRWEGAFNFPRKINFAVRQTDAPYVLLLNDDVEPINADWLDAMLEYAHQPQIGAVGAKLFYPDGRLQHVGVAVGVCGVAAHLLHQHPGGTQGCGGIAVSVRNCSAVTGACLLTRRDVYDEAGGFDEALALDFNDVDFCLRVRRAGYRIVFTPHARLFHHESASFGTRRQRAEEVAAMWERWRGVLDRDPYYNVNLSRQFPDCRIRSCK